VAPNLKSRLARMQKMGLTRASELNRVSTTGDSAAAPKPGFLDDWERVGELAWARTQYYYDPLPESLDPAIFAALHKKKAGTSPGADLAVRESGERLPSELLRFFDLETTGLSGGTGTVAFLAAVGYRDPDGGDGDRAFAVRQLFLEDYPGEPDFLAALLSLIEGRALVSYNGKAFDLPLLRTRCVMNGIPLPAGLASPHIDALFAARRLWKRVLGGASLGQVESGALDIERKEDIPGAMIPQVWLDYARSREGDSGGESPLMGLVLSHNAADIVGLARVAARIQAVYDHPAAQEACQSIDRGALGRGLLAIGREEEGEALLEAASGDGDEEAGLLLAMRCRRSGRVEDALRAVDTLPDSYRAAVERAKLQERLLRDYAEAARWAERARRLASSEGEKEAALRRLARLERRLDR
jgi:uncharacterized protein